jgi:hypothetical protein
MRLEKSKRNKKNSSLEGKNIISDGRRLKEIEKIVERKLRE